MPLELRPAKLADAATLTEIYFSAFSIDAISLLAFPRTTASYNWWYDSIIEELADPHAHFLCIYDSSSPDQSPIAFAKWNDADSPPQTGDNMPKWPEGSDAVLADHFFGSLVRKHGEIMRGRRHWYLEILATRPEWQGKGAGGKLLRWGLRKADEEGTETYLEASPDGKPIYEHLGFEEVDRLVVQLEGKGEGVLSEKEFVECFMVRGVTEKGK
jgi:GNAT superfamily N-acetyltransferase